MRMRPIICHANAFKENVRIFYQKWMEEQAQKLVDATAKAYLQQKARIEATRALQKVCFQIFGYLALC